MKPDKFLDAMGNVDDSIIDEYTNSKKARRTPAWVKIVSIAASVMVVLSVSLIIFLNGGDPATNPPADGNAESAAEGESPDMSRKGFKVLSVSADKMVGNFIAGDTTFTVKTENGTEDDVRSHLFISSAPNYTVTKTASDTFKVRLNKGVSANTVVSLSYVEDGIIDQSWAFQTESKLTLSDSYPADGAKTVSPNSVIELEFSYSAAEGIEEAVTFSPKISGSWEHAGKIWRFTPDSSLERNSTYVINVGKGITAEGKEIEKTSAITFSTYEQGIPYTCSSNIVTVDGINSYLPGSNVFIKFTDTSKNPVEVGKVSLKKFGSHEDMIAFAEGESDFILTDYMDSKFICKTVENSYGSSRTLILKLTDEIPQGYYAARVYADDGAHLFDWIIQVHPLSLYAAVTERDVLVWTALDGKLAEGVSVRFNGTDGKTGKNGTLLLEDVTDGSGEVRYLYAGDEKTPFVMGSPSFTHENYPGAYIYTDKPKYKNNDTVNIWGIIPLELFYDEVDGKFEVMLGNESDTAIEIKPDENGTFQCAIELSNHADSYPSVYLMYNGTVLASDSLSISEYSLDNYKYETFVDKNFVKNGETLKFDVKLSHISGISVSGKALRASCGYGDDSFSITATTDKNGVAHFSIPADDYSGLLRSDLSLNSIATLNININNANAGEDYNDAASVEMFVITSPIMSTYSTKGDSFEIRAYYIDNSGIDKIDRSDLYTSGDLTVLPFCGKPAGGKVTATVTLTKTTREIEDTLTDELTKAKYNIYSDSTESETAKTYKVTAALNNGIAVIDTSGYKLPSATGTSRYTLSATAAYDSGDGNKHSFSLPYIAYNSFVESEIFTGKNNALIIDPYNGILGSDSDYYLYGYKFIFDKSKHLTADDVLSVTLTDENGVNADEGKVLFFINSQDVREVHVKDAPEFEIPVTDATFPNVNSAGAYFKDGVFHRVSPGTLTRDPAERTISLDLSTDKKEYGPGDEVTLTVTANSKNGKLSGAAVNVSVVNAANANHWSADAIANRLHQGVTIRDYFYSSYRDYNLHGFLGGMGGGGEPDKFSDTIYFGSGVTGDDGKYTVTFKLPDDTVTTYRITVHAANKELYSGSAIKDVTAESDFFVQPGEVKQAKAADDLAVSATLISEVSGNADITFRLNELDTKKTVSTSSGKTVFANFGKVPAGDYTVTVSAVSKSGDPAKTHEVTFPVKVAASTLKITEEHETAIDGSETLTPASSPVTLKFMTEETARYLRYIDHAENNRSTRLDTHIGYQQASVMKNKLRGNNSTGTTLSTFNYEKWDSDLRTYLLSSLPNGTGDPVLTALHSYLYGNPYSTARFTSAANETEIAESLLNRAAAGEVVLADLLYAKDKVSDDPYVRMILSIALSISGDTHTAAEILVPPEENVSEGEKALYAIALIFTDREAAAKEIDSLVESDPTETYLGIATAIYMKSGENQTGEGKTVTVVCGDKEIPVTVNELVINELVVSTKEGDTVSFKDAAEGLRALYSYEASFTPAENDRNKKGILCEIDTTVNVLEEVTLSVDLSSVFSSSGESQSGTVKIALPNCFRQSGRGTTNERNIYEVTVNESSPQYISIPLMAVAPGNYTIEPAVFTADNGVNYYSDPIKITVSE